MPRQRRVWTPLLLLCSVLAAVLPMASALQAVIYPARDGTLIEPAGNEINAAGLSDGIYAGMLAEGRRMRGVLWFNIDREIPRGSSITSASLVLFLQKVKIPLPKDYTLHRLTKRFGEGTSSFNGGKGAPATTNDVTWQHAMYPFSEWEQPGGDYTATPSATTKVSFAQMEYTWTGLEADVQFWADNPNDDHGFILIGYEVCADFCDPSARRFVSKDKAAQEAQWPRLVVEYTPPNTSYATCCLPDGDCRLDTESNCVDDKGNFNPGTLSCSDVQCSAECTPEEIAIGACKLGACCADEQCLITTEDRCKKKLKGQYNGDDSECNSESCALRLEPFVDALPIPAVAQPYKGRAGGKASYIMSMDEFEQKLHRDLPPTTVWGFNGMFPGPTLEAWTDDPIEVTWVNNLRDVTTGKLRTSHYLEVDECLHGPNFSKAVPFTVPHLHGGKIVGRWDGHPDFQFPPGTNDTYIFHNEQKAGTLWYHDHALGITRMNAYMGLAGFYLVRDEHETNLQLPSGKYEIPLAIMDRQLNRDGSLYYPSSWTGAFTGDFLLVNGKVTPFVRVERRAYRFRILNGCGTRLLELKMGKGKFWVVGTERSLRRKRWRTSRVLLTPGERIDVVVDFSQYRIAQKIKMVNKFPRSHAPGTPSVSENVLEFHVIESPRAPEYKPPKTLDTSVKQLRTSTSYVKREFLLQELAKDTCGGKTFQINKLGWDDLTDFPVAGSREEWTFVNLDATHIHPMHTHLAEFTVLSRQKITVNADGSYDLVGEPSNPLIRDRGWKDMVAVFPQEAVKVVVDFPGGKYGGRFPFHCHVLEHEDHDMMRQFHLQQSKCNFNMVCEDGEDCYSCPSDCAFSSGARCGNGLCEAGDGENCANCPEDCPGFPGGVCCGFGPTVFDGYEVGMTTIGCSHDICREDGVFCRDVQQVKACCGDTLCTGSEDASCPLDCEHGVLPPVWRWPGLQEM